MGRRPDEAWGAHRRWKKSPAEALQDLTDLWEHYRRQHDSDPAEVVEDIFTDFEDVLTGFCRPDLSWTEDADVSAEPPR